MADLNDFKKSIDIIIHRHEGTAFTCDPQDTDGGGTKFGITLKFLVDHPDYGDMNGDRSITVEDLKAMPEDWAEYIYEKFFWNWWPMEHIPAPLAHLCHDIGINSGQRTAAKLLQQTLGCVPDGVIGPATLREIADIIDVRSFCNLYLNFRMDNYNTIVRNNPSKAKFWAGWRNRVKMLRKECCEEFTCN
jgi:lysozyme family protein